MHHFHKLVHKTMRQLSCVLDQKPAQAEALVGQTSITLLLEASSCLHRQWGHVSDRQCFALCA